MKWKAKNLFDDNVIMKGSNYIFLQFFSGDLETILSFKDVLQYTVPCPLSKFLKQWKIPEAKGIFPHGYEFF